MAATSAKAPRPGQTMPVKKADALLPSSPAANHAATPIMTATGKKTVHQGGRNRRCSVSCDAPDSPVMDAPRVGHVQRRASWERASSQGSVSLTVHRERPSRPAADGFVHG
ncbi:MAG: hypothetical protein HYX51_03120 [Chloroflexi bacterium]|nr:hypothetical protein [Chloroflexota bacterium]